MFCTTANSYLEATSRKAATAAELAASNKVVKYAGLSSQGEFVPIAVESHCPIIRDALQFLSELGRPEYGSLPNKFGNFCNFCAPGGFPR